MNDDADTEVNANDESIEEALKRAQALSLDKKEEEARTILKEIVTKEPNNRVAIIMLAGSYFCTLHFREAIVAFERLVLLEPKLAQASIGLVNSYISLDQKDNALREIERFESLAEAGDDKELLEQYQKLKPQLV